MAMKLSAELFNEIVSSLKSDGTWSRGHEKRSEARVGLRCGMEIKPCSFTAKNARPVVANIHDLSAGGIGFVTSQSLELDSDFVATFVRDGRGAVPVLYKVRHIRRLTADLYNVGANFLRILPDAYGEIAPLRTGKKDRRKKPRFPGEQMVSEEIAQPAVAAAAPSVAQPTVAAAPAPQAA